MTATVEILMEQIGHREVQPRAAIVPARLVVRVSARLPSVATPRRRTASRSWTAAACGRK